MKKVLIITHQNDNYSIETVTKQLEEQGAEVFRFDSDIFPSKISVSQFISDNEICSYVERDGKKHLLDEFESIWYRRFYLGHALDREIPEMYREPILEESKRTLLGILETTPVFKLDDYRNVRRTSDKHLQLQIARECGLRIPNTLVTNNADDLRKFNADNESGIISKMQTSFAIYDEGVENVVFTNTMKPEHFENLEELQNSPMKFQEKIDKEVELRVTIVGDKIFPFSIDSQKLDGSKDDWRKEGVSLINDWLPCELPDDLNEKLLMLMDKLKLNYGAMDLILTPDGEYVFLEVNPVGEFFWLDRLSDGKISSAITNLLLGEGKRRVKMN